MPHINIWVRKEDYDSWQTIRDKPTFLHNAITMREDYKALTPTERKVVKDHLKVIPKIIKIPEEIDPILVPKIATNIDRYSNGLCKIHSTPLDNRGKCLQKGCKYT